MVEHDIAGISEEAHRLAKDQDGVEAEYAVTDDYETPREADPPKAHRQDGFVAAVTVIPLINKPEREDHLPGGAPKEQPRGNGAVVEEAQDKIINVGKEQPHGQHRQKEYYPPYQQRQLVPEAFDIQIPNVNIIGNELAEDDGKIIAQPAIQKKQYTARKREYPVEIWRHHLPGPLRQEPLHQHPGGEKALRQEANRVNKPRRYLHRIQLQVLPLNY